MEDNRWPKTIYQWTPHGKERRGRQQRSWKKQVTDFMRSRHMEEDMIGHRYIWHLGMDRAPLVVYILIIKKNKYVT